MSFPNEYSSRLFRIPKDTLRSFNTLAPSKSLAALVGAWLSLIFLVVGMRFLFGTSYFWWVYVPAIFLIASRYGVLLQLCHEAAHHLLSPSRTTNDFLANWFCTSPIGVSFDGYRKGHLRHHAWTNTDKDPASDTEKYRVVDFRKAEIYLLFLKDVLGLTAFQIFFEYRDYESGAQEPDRSLRDKLLTLIRLGVTQAVLLTILFQWDLRAYFLLWLIPAISPHMVLMRVRGIAEHGQAKQLGVLVQHPMEGSFYTRSFLTPQNAYRFSWLTSLEKTLIGSLNVHYHHEHHLFPTVPFYHLPELHELVAPKVKELNPHAYAKGYFAAALAGLRKPETVQGPVLQLHSP